MQPGEGRGGHPSRGDKGAVASALAKAAGHPIEPVPYSELRRAVPATDTEAWVRWASSELPRPPCA